MNGWTPTPRNAERIEHDRNQQEFWQAATLAYLFEQENRPTEADADRLHELIEEALSQEKGLRFLELSDTTSIAMTPKIVMPLVSWQIEAEAQAADANDWDMQTNELRNG